MCCALLLIGVAAGDGYAQETDQASTFVKSLVEAINSKSLDRRKALLHPKALVCASAEPESFYVWSVTGQARETVSANHRWILTALPPDAPPMFADKFDYPIRPTHLLQIDTEADPTRGTTMIFQIVYDGNRWYDVTACPTPETIASARAARKAEAERAERVRALAASMPPELREMIVKLVKEGRRIDAIKHYQSASGEDLTTAVEVVEQVAPKAR